MMHAAADTISQPMEGVEVPMSVFTNHAAFIQAARAGLAGKVVKQAVDAVGHRDLFGRLVGVTPGNLHRVYRRKTLGPTQSEALLDVLRVFFQASRAFGGSGEAREWLATSLPALGGQRPLDLCDTFNGRRLVQDTIGKIEQGEFP